VSGRTVGGGTAPCLKKMWLRIDISVFLQKEQKYFLFLLFLSPNTFKISASNRNEYQERFLGVKAAGA
jgi:hypothetical protein